MNLLVKILLVFVSGGIGAVCRLLINNCVRTTGLWMGLSTLVVNTIGCLLIGIFAGWVMVSGWSQTVRTAFTMLTMVGFCGGFSTFSSFTLDCVKYFEAGHLGVWVIFGTLTVFVGLFSCALGYWLGQHLG